MIGRATRPVLAILGYAPKAYREYALRGAAEVAEIWIITPVVEPWHSAVGTRVLNQNLDTDSVFETLIELLHGRLDAILTFDERYVELTSQLVEALGLRGPSVDAVLNFKDKATFRARTAGQPYAVRFDVADSAHRAQEIADRLGYPVIFKPRALGGSFGVVRVDSADAIAEAFRFADSARIENVPNPHRGVLVEEYVAGPEVSVDASVHNGHTQVHFIADKILGDEPYFEEQGHTVPTRYTDHVKRIEDVVRQVHEVAGFDNGISHIEMRLSDHGPKVIEANARLGGDLIPYLGMLASGSNLGRVAAEIALDLSSAATPPPSESACIRFLSPPKRMVLSAISWGDATNVDDDIALQLVQLLPAGSLLVTPPEAFLSRAGYILGRGPESDSTTRAVTEVAAATELLREGQAVPSTTGGPNQPTHVAIVDPLSTGKMYPSMLRSAGLDLTEIITTRSSVLGKPDPPHERDYPRIIVSSTDDFDKVLTTCRARGVQHVIAGAESGVPLALWLADALAGIHEDRSVLFDKGKMMQRLRDEGVPTLEFQNIQSSREAVAFFESFDFDTGSVVVKPAVSAGSAGVVHIEGAAAGKRAVSTLLGSDGFFADRIDCVVAQEYCAGTEFVVDAFSYDGNHSIANVCTYTKYRTTKGHFAYHTMDWVRRDDSIAVRVMNYARAVLDALGRKQGSTHMEIILRDGEPRLIDLGARASGAQHPLKTLALTADSQVHREIAYLKSGEIPPSDFTLHRQGRIVFFNPDVPSRVMAHNPPGAFSDVPNIEMLEVQARHGDVLKPPEDLLDTLVQGGMCFVVADSTDELNRLEQTVRDRFAQIVEPLPTLTTSKSGDHASP